MTTHIDFKKNSLNTFRLLAALQVLYGHAIVHLNLPRIPVLGSFLSFFSGVPIFFTLSGFLIWRSVGQSSSFLCYAKKRFWRIYPELWVAVLVEIVVILLLYNSPIDYGMMGLFAFTQATIFQFWTPDFLRGYGCGTPNGALWTITVLIQFYLIVYFVYKYLHNKRLAYWIVWLALSVIIGFITPYIQSVLPESIEKVYGVSIFPYFWMFLVSAFVAEFKDTFLDWFIHYWGLFIIIAVTVRYAFDWDLRLGMYSFFYTILLFVGIVGFAYRFPLVNIKRDISYGIYIYHMTVVNALLAMGFKGHIWTLWAVIIITLILAWLSTITVGRMSINRKHIIADHTVSITKSFH